MGLPAVNLNPVEAAAFADLPESKVRKEVEHGLLGSVSPPRLPFSDLVYLRALSFLELDLGVDDRRKLLLTIRNALVHGVPEVLELNRFLLLRFRPIVEDLVARVEAFDQWKSRLVIDDKILGGEPVFPRSRLAVRHVGSLAERGETVEAILTDYPYLKAQDIDFAKLFTRAYPRLGRPRDSRSASAR